jgi:hypothetical protein
MRLTSLLIIAASATADPGNGNTFSSKAAKPEETLAGLEHGSRKKKSREEKKKKKAEVAQLKITDPLLGLEKEIEDLVNLEGELNGSHASSDVGTSAKVDASTAPGVSFTSGQVDEPAKDCTQEMCQYQLEPDYLLEYKVNVPQDTTVEECVGCSLSVKLTFEGTAWLALALSTNGEMIGSEAVM